MLAGVYYLSALAAHLVPIKPGEIGRHLFFPYGRGSHDLRVLATRSFKIRKERYVEHQLPDSVTLPSGRTIFRPAGW